MKLIATKTTFGSGRTAYCGPDGKEICEYSEFGYGPIEKPEDYKVMSRSNGGRLLKAAKFRGAPVWIATGAYDEVEAIYERV